MKLFIHRPVTVAVFSDLTPERCDIQVHFLRPGTLLEVKNDYGGGLFEVEGLGWAEVPRGAYTPAAPPVGRFSAN